MSSAEAVLSHLGRDVLKRLADTFDVEVSDRRSVVSLRNALVTERLLLEDVFPELGMAELRELGLALGVAPARSRADMEDRLRAALSPVAQPTRVSFVAVDFETADNGRDSACQVAVVRVEAGEVVARQAHFVRPPRSYFLHSGVHGITWRDVARAPTFGQLWPGLGLLFQGVSFIAAHNAGFDRSVLVACCAAAAVHAPSAPFVCTVKLARATWALPRSRLPDVCRHLGIPLRHHDAVSDAEACARIVLAAGADRL